MLCTSRLTATSGILQPGCHFFGRGSGGVHGHGGDLRRFTQVVEHLDHAGTLLDPHQLMGDKKLLILIKGLKGLADIKQDVLAGSQGPVCVGLGNADGGKRLLYRFGVVDQLQKTGL